MLGIVARLPNGGAEVSVVDLSSLQTIESNTFTQITGLAQQTSWSHDMAYLAFLTGNADTNHAMAMIHLKTGTISQLFAVDLPTPEYNYQDVAGPRISPDGTKILYFTITWRQNVMTTSHYVANLHCDPVTYACILDNPRALIWPHDESYDLSWGSDSSSILIPYSISQVDSSSEPHLAYRWFIDIKYLNNQLLRRIAVTNLIPSLDRIASIRGPVAISQNGKRLAFSAEVTLGRSDIVILNIDDLSVNILTTPSFPKFSPTDTLAWMP